MADELRDGKLDKPTSKRRARRVSKPADNAGSGTSGTSGAAASAGSGGSADPGAAQGAEETPVVVVRAPEQVAEKKPPRQRPPRIAPIRTKTERKGEADQSATAIVMTLDGIVGVSLGDECRMTKVEQALILEPLKQLLADLPEEQAAIVSKFTVPAGLIAGVLAWATRIVTVLRERRAAEQQQAELEAHVLASSEGLAGASNGNGKIRTGPVDPAILANMGKGG